MILLCLVSTDATVNCQHVDNCHCHGVPLIRIEKIVIRGLIFLLQSMPAVCTQISLKFCCEP